MHEISQPVRIEFTNNWQLYILYHTPTQSLFDRPCWGTWFGQVQLWFLMIISQLKLTDMDAWGIQQSHLVGKTDILLKPQGAIPTGSNLLWRNKAYCLVPEVPIFRVILMEPEAFCAHWAYVGNSLGPGPTLKKGLVLYFHVRWGHLINTYTLS